MAMKLITRAEAINKKLKHYFTGKACPKNHISDRKVSNGKCRLCVRIETKNWRRLNPEKHKIRTKIQRLKNPEKFNAYSRKWYRNNIKKAGDTRKRWQQNNREASRSIVRNRRARKRNAKGRHTKYDINRLFFIQKGKCVASHCNVSIIKGYHVDHKKPLSRGGSNWPRNLQLLCATCNSSKGAKTIQEWNMYHECW